MSSFSGNVNDLADAISYELGAIEFVRVALFGHKETRAAESLYLRLGEKSSDGVQKASARITAHITDSMSQEGVRNALSRLRPLAFSATFKMQDMIAEWTLRANAKNGWTFKNKLKDYDDLRSTHSLVEAPLFAKQQHLSRAFWELYRFFKDYRGTVTHSGGVVLGGDGAIEIVYEGKKISLTEAEQGSYLRGVCLIAKALIGVTHLDAYLLGLIDSDFLMLQKYHGQKGFSVKDARVECLTVEVPTSRVTSQNPLSVDIDFDELRNIMEGAFPVKANGHLYYSVTIKVNSDRGEAVWSLPIESVPSGLATLREGDSKFDGFLQLSLPG